MGGGGGSGRVWGVGVKMGLCFLKKKEGGGKFGE